LPQRRLQVFLAHWSVSWHITPGMHKLQFSVMFASPLRSVNCLSAAGTRRFLLYF
jgi:hypothetical protein